MARTIESPGVEIREIDLSNISTLPVGTQIFLQGFCASGPYNELVNITSVSEFESIYGQPTNAAERFSYQSARQILQSPGRLVFNRLPYGSNEGEGTGSNYTVLAYPFAAVPTSDADTSGGTSTDVSFETFYDENGDLLTPDGESFSVIYLSGGNESASELAALRVGQTLQSTTSSNDVSESNIISSNITALSTVAQADGPLDETMLRVTLGTPVYIDQTGSNAFTILSATITDPDSYSIDFSKSDEYQGIVVGAPTLVSLTKAEYQSLKQGDISGAGSDATWLSGYDSSADYTITDKSDLYKSAFIVANDFRTAIDTDNTGYFLAVTDNTNLDDIVYDKVKDVQTRVSGGSFASLGGADNPSAAYTFQLSGTNTQDSISQIVETANGVDFGAAEFNDVLQVSLFKLRSSNLNSVGGDVRTALTQQLISTTVGSIDVSRKSGVLSYDNSEENIFLDKTVEENSAGFISTTVNPQIAASFADKIVSMGGDNTSVTLATLSGARADGNFGFTTTTLADSVADQVVSTINGSELSGSTGTTEALYSIGEFEPCNDKTFKVIGNTAGKVDRGFRLAENRDLIPLDIVVDGGLSTIEAISHEISAGRIGEEYNGKDIYDDTVFANLVDESTLKQNAFESWKSIYNLYETFCEDTRGDCMFIVDPLRNIFVQGRNGKVSDTDGYSFSTDILTPLRTLTESSNSNYGAVYGNWVKSVDITSGERYWYPYSGYQAAIMARLDSVQQPWYPPAGLNNGQIRNVVDLGVEPNQRERDLLYRYNINPITLFPGDGFVVMGQKTLQKKPSAFDRINVRRLFLSLEKATRRVSRYFVMELNTAFTRTRLVNVLTPIFENAKNNQGVYDYLIVCDERNNTPDVIDRNELAVDIYLKPTRAAEFILINFVATRTGDDFSEIVL